MQKPKAKYILLNVTHLSDSQEVFDSKETAMLHLPLTPVKQLGEDPQDLLHAFDIHVTQCNSQSLGTSLADRSNYLKQQQKTSTQCALRKIGICMQVCTKYGTP